MTSSVIDASPEQIPALLSIENASFSCPWSEESFRGAFASESVSVLAAMSEDGTLAGFAVLLIAGDEGELLNIASSPDFRRMGVGQALLEASLEKCRAAGVQTLYLEVRASNHPARSLYRKNDFSEVGIRRNYYQNPREDAILMKLELSPLSAGAT